MPDPWGCILLLIVLIFLSGFFSVCETAIMAQNPGKIKKAAADRSMAAAIISKFLDKSDRFNGTVRVGINFSGFLASALAAVYLAEELAQALSKSVTLSVPVLKILSIVFITFLFTFIFLVFGEFIPKKLAQKYGEQAAFQVAVPVRLFDWVAFPFVFLLLSVSNILLKLFGLDKIDKSEEVTEDEIRMLIDAGNESGTIAESEKDMLHNIFEFDERVVEDIMTHRTKITAVGLDTPLPEIIDTAVAEGYSRIPVYDDDLDNIIGILYIKDLVALLASAIAGGGLSEQAIKSFDIKHYMRQALYVPESARVKELFAEFKKTRIQMAVVIDEYGGTAGIVTMEDLLESIVGSIQDEYDDENEDINIQKLSDTEYLIKGTTPIEEVEELFEIDFHDEDDFDTLGGFITATLGQIPVEGEHPKVTVGNIEFEVVSVVEHRIEQVCAVISKKSGEEDHDHQNLSE